MKEQALKALAGRRAHRTSASSADATWRTCRESTLCPTCCSRTSAISPSGDDFQQDPGFAGERSAGVDGGGGRRGQRRPSRQRGRRSRAGERRAARPRDARAPCNVSVETRRAWGERKALLPRAHVLAGRGRPHGGGECSSTFIGERNCRHDRSRWRLLGVRVGDGGQNSSTLRGSASCPGSGDEWAARALALRALGTKPLAGAPAGLPIRYDVWWAFHRLGVFESPGYAVLLAYLGHELVPLDVHVSQVLSVPLHGARRFAAGRPVDASWTPRRRNRDRGDRAGHRCAARPAVAGTSSPARTSRRSERPSAPACSASPLRDA